MFSEKGPTVLLVHYYRKPRQVMREFLEENGYDVVEAKNKHEAVNYLTTSQTPDIIILDSQWPDENHLSLCRQIRSVDGQSHLILIRDHAREEEIEYERNIGISTHLFQPFSQDELLKTLVDSKAVLCNNLS